MVPNPFVGKTKESYDSNKLEDVLGRAFGSPIVHDSFGMGANCASSFDVDEEDFLSVCMQQQDNEAHERSASCGVSFDLHSSKYPNDNQKCLQPSERRRRALSSQGQLEREQYKVNMSHQNHIRGGDSANSPYKAPMPPSLNARINNHRSPMGLPPSPPPPLLNPYPSFRRSFPMKVRNLEPIGDDLASSEGFSLTSSCYNISGNETDGSVLHERNSFTNIESGISYPKKVRDDGKYLSNESSLEELGRNIEPLSEMPPAPETDAQDAHAESKNHKFVRESYFLKKKKKRSHTGRRTDCNLKKSDDRAHREFELSQGRERKRVDRDEKFMKRFLNELENDREIIMSEWKKEFDNTRQVNWDNNDGSSFSRRSWFKKCFEAWIGSIMSFLSFAEVFLSNMPLTIGAVGLSWVTQGTIFFKFMEENIDACTPVRYNSDQCTFGEFPGCFECDRSNPVYIAGLTFHYFCHLVAFTCVLLFLLKLLLARRVVADELSNPTTSSPMGIVCITTECIFAGIFGRVGESIVLGVSIFHVLLSFWFIYMAIWKFRLLPDPSWYPNCIGLAYAAVKSWLYYPIAGKFFMSICMFYFFSMFFVGSVRVISNHKIAAPVCFIGLSAPSITMYAMTIMAQPSRHREEVIEGDPTLMQRFEQIHHNLYIPVMHCMMIFSLMGMVSALHSLYSRWPSFRQKEFSPAHFAFIFPVLSHTNAVQAYRSGVDSFAGIPIGSPFKIVLFNYWLMCLLFGTIANFIFTAKYIRRLPQWTKIDVSPDEELPLSPSHTLVHEVMYESDAHETILSQHFVSPAVLQANETGSLVRVRRGTDDYAKYGPYVRTRNVLSYGFDIPMSEAELRQERAELLHWVSIKAPRTRNRTLSQNAALVSFLPFVRQDLEEDQRGVHQRIEGHGTFGGYATFQANSLNGNGHDGNSSTPLVASRHVRSHTIHHV